MTEEAKPIEEKIEKPEPTAYEKLQQDYSQAVQELGQISAEKLSHKLALKDLFSKKRGIADRIEKILKKVANLPKGERS